MIAKKRVTVHLDPADWKELMLYVLDTETGLSKFYTDMIKKVCVPWNAKKLARPKKRKVKT